MTQKVLKVGSSAAVTIPKEVLKVLGVKIGDRVHVQTYPELRVFVITSIHNKKKAAFEIASWTDHCIKNYGPVLRALSKSKRRKKSPRG